MSLQEKLKQLEAVAENPGMTKKLIAIITELLGQRDFLKETLKDHVANVTFTDDTECLWKILEGE